MPKASGRAPNIAANVVIMIGRKRSRQACVIASRVSSPSRSACSAKSIIMIAFFLTMPISRMIPMKAMMVNSVSNSFERDQRADARRGQRRQDGDRMNVALVEHAEHDIDGEQRRADQQQLTRLRLLRSERGAGERAAHRRGHTDAAHGVLDLAFCASLSALPGARLNEIVAGGELALVIDARAACGPASNFANAESGTIVSTEVETAEPGRGAGMAARGERIGREVARRVGRDRRRVLVVAAVALKLATLTLVDCVPVGFAPDVET